jgi:hypothetical protein
VHPQPQDLGLGLPAGGDTIDDMSSCPRRSPLPLLLVPALIAAVLLGAAAADEDEAPGGPRLVVDREVHAFGTAAQEEELHAEFTYRNAGDETVTGIKAIGDCGCYGVTLSAETLEPGEEGTLQVSFRTLMFSGTVNKRLRLAAANLPGKDVFIKLSVDVVGGVILDPGRVWFGDVLEGTIPTQKIVAKWHKEEGTPFQIESVEVPGHEFDVALEPYDTAEWQGTEIALTFKTPPPLGMFSATALIRTDHPDFPRISLALSANVSGKVWVQSRTLYFGWVTQGREKSTTILVRGITPDVDLGDVTARSRHGHVDVALEANANGREGWWRLVVTVGADAEPGKIDDVIEIHSAVPGEEITEVHVRGEVLEIGR